MEQKYNNLSDFTLHNYYHIQIRDENDNITYENYAYNEANSSAYLSSGVIYILRLVGTTRERYIEPYTAIDDNITTYWNRNIEPSYEIVDGKVHFKSGYEATVFFPPKAGGGTITGIELVGTAGTISHAELKDIEGDPIIYNYGDFESITIKAYIYFLYDMSGKDTGKNHWENYPIKFFQPSNSIFCGCCGNDTSLLVKERAYYSPSYGWTDGGYMPSPVSKYIGFSKSPIPLEDRYGFLRGGINNYQILTPNTGTTYKNATFPKNFNYDSNSCWKGLIKVIVLPGIGVIDLANAHGPRGKGIFKGSIVKKQTPCYIPAEYVENDDDSLISITKNAFYNAPHVIVRRRRSADPTKGRKAIDEEIPLDTAYFPDYSDTRVGGCTSASQHIPLTDYYCGADTIIPSAGGSFVGEDYSMSEYIITYTGEEGERETYLTANYVVSGEAITTNYDGYSSKITFPYVLSYSFDGNNFITAASFSSNSTPYTPVYFPAVSAPIWRLSSEISGRLLANAYTTHSDKHISDICGISENGYDPLFIFVGYNRSKDNRNFDSIEDPEIKRKTINSVNNTPNFVYGENMGKNLPDTFKTTVPYLYHKNDSIFFCGTLGGKQ